MVATLDWTIAETLIAMNSAPIAIGDAIAYQRWVGKPSLPNNTIDLGIRLQPNLEQIWILSQQFNNRSLQFINSDFYTSISSRLENIVPVHVVNFHRTNDAWQNLIDATQEIAILINNPQAAQILFQNYQKAIAKLRPLAKVFIQRPVILAQFIDTRHLRIYAENSVLGNVLKQLGFNNAWQGNYNKWGFETVSITELAKFPTNSRFIIIKPYPANIKTALHYNTLWQHLSLTQDPLILPAVWTFGGIPSAQRFAEILLERLQKGGEEW
ncbi:iron ABC transporter substrate-binding protein [Rodentibacter caecimuris]|uniref:Iron ABC transporter substrate-binding protein n=2 Tax=Rodentibacter caecimuris TaxID=1796644 RepID=A0ABX3KWS8_9PAST|nr:iron ABC transporter substrate-binding protein [Rodentibacter heylii]